MRIFFTFKYFVAQLEGEGGVSTLNLKLITLGTSRSEKHIFFRVYNLRFKQEKKSWLDKLGPTVISRKTQLIGIWISGYHCHLYLPSISNMMRVTHNVSQTWAPIIKIFYSIRCDCFEQLTWTWWHNQRQGNPKKPCDLLCSSRCILWEKIFWLTSHLWFI